MLKPYVLILIQPRLKTNNSLYINRLWKQELMKAMLSYQPENYPAVSTISNPDSMTCLIRCGEDNFRTIDSLTFYSETDTFIPSVSCISYGHYKWLSPFGFNSSSSIIKTFPGGPYLNKKFNIQRLIDEYLDILEGFNSAYEDDICLDLSFRFGLSGDYDLSLFSNPTVLN